MNTRPIPSDFIPTQGLLENHRILITGAGDGYGKAIAKACAAYGATTILLGRTLAKLEKVYDEIEQCGDPQPAIYPLNLEGATPKDYANLAEVIGNELGPLDGLVHNAAVLGGLTPIALYEEDVWARVMQVNLNGPMSLTKSCWPLLNASSKASVVFIGDRLRDETKPYWGAYAAGKHAQYALMRTLAAEATPDGGPRVNTFDPGPMNTRLRTNAYPGIAPGTWANPDERVNPILYLLSDASRKINGELMIDTHHE